MTHFQTATWPMIGSVVLFLVAAALGTLALYNGRHMLAAINGLLMLANLAIYLINSGIRDRIRYPQ